MDFQLKESRLVHTIYVAERTSVAKDATRTFGSFQPVPAWVDLTVTKTKNQEGDEVLSSATIMTEFQIKSSSIVCLPSTEPPSVERALDVLSSYSANDADTGVDDFWLTKV